MKGGRSGKHYTPPTPPELETLPQPLLTTHILTPQIHLSQHYINLDGPLCTDGFCHGPIIRRFSFLDIKDNIVSKYQPSGKGGTS